MPIVLEIEVEGLSESESASGSLCMRQIWEASECKKKQMDFPGPVASVPLPQSLILLLSYLAARHHSDRLF